MIGMKKAQLTFIQADDMEYAKSSNDFNVFVTVDMEPYEGSVYDPEQTSTSVNVRLLRQDDGRYLIDEFGR